MLSGLFALTQDEVKQGHRFLMLGRLCCIFPLVWARLSLISQDPDMNTSCLIAAPPFPEIILWNKP